MSETDARQTLPSSLTVKSDAEGKGNRADDLVFIEKEAMTDFHNFLMKRYADYAPYITLEDMTHLWATESQESLRLMPTRDRIIAMDKRMDILAKIDHEEVMGLIEYRFRKVKEEHQKQKKHAHHLLGSREFTFTYSPKWFDDETARLTMTKAIQRLMKYYENEMIEFRAVGEVGTNGLSHVHCFYKLQDGLKITDKNFKRAYPYWDTKKKQGYSGHQGGHHANVKSESDFMGYMEKDIETAWLDIHHKKPE